MADERTTAADGEGPQMDHPEVVAARIAHGVDEQGSSKKAPTKKSSASKK